MQAAAAKKRVYLNVTPESQCWYVTNWNPFEEPGVGTPMPGTLRSSCIVAGPFRRQKEASDWLGRQAEVFRKTSEVWQHP